MFRFALYEGCFFSLRCIMASFGFNLNSVNQREGSRERAAKYCKQTPQSSFSVIMKLATAPSERVFLFALFLSFTLSWLIAAFFPDWIYQDEAQFFLYFTLSLLHWNFYPRSFNHWFQKEKHFGSALTNYRAGQCIAEQNSSPNSTCAFPFLVITLLSYHCNTPASLLSETT